MKEVSFQSPLSLAIAEGATTPNPGFAGARVWSSTLSRPVTWDGSKWTAKSTAGGSANSVQYHNSGLIDGATNVAIHGGDLAMATSSSPTTPSAGTIKTIVKPLTSGGSPRLLAKIPNGAEIDLLNRELSSRVGWVLGGASALQNSGIRSPTVLGTAAVVTISSSNKISSQARTRITSGATAESFAGDYFSAATVVTSDGAGIGGFVTDLSFGIEDASLVSGARTFCGLATSTSAPTNVAPSTLTNCIGIGHDEGDTNFKLYYGGSAAQTPIDLGANFPVNVTDWYHLVIASYPGVSGVYEYRVRRWTTTAMYETSGAIGPLTATEIPQALSLLAQQAWRCNNATASGVRLSIGKYTQETW